MKTSLLGFKIFTLLLVLVLTTGMVNAQTRTATISGPWNSIATWNNQSVPTSVNDVIINNGVTVTVNGADSCASLTIGATNATGGISISGANSLVVTNDVTIGDLQDNTSGITIAVGTGTFSCASITMADVTLSNDAIALTVSTGTATIGNIIMNGAAAENLIDITTTGTLNIGGNISLNIANGTLDATAASAKVNYNGADQTIRPQSYTNLLLSGSGTKTLTGLPNITNLTMSGSAIATTVTAITIGNDVILSNTASLTTGNSLIISGDLTVGSGSSFAAGGFNLTVTGNTLVTGILSHSSAAGTKSFVGNVTINSTGIWNDDAAAIAVAFSGNLQNDGTFNAGTGLHTFTVNAKTFSGTSGISIPNITISGSRTNSGTLITSTLNVNAALTNNGTVTASTALSGTNTFTQGANAILNIGGSSGITGLTATANPNTVNYTGTGQTLKTGTYHHLNLSGSGTVTAIGILDMNGNITIGNGVTLNGGTFAHLVGGNWINNGGTYTSTGSVTFNGTSQSIGGSSATNFNTLAFNGAPTTTTLAANVSVAGDLTLSTGDVLDLVSFSCNRVTVGGTLSLTATSILKLSGSNFPLNFTTNTLSGTVNYYNATGGQTIHSTPYATLTLGNTSGIQTAGGNLTVATLNNSNAGSTLDMSTFQLTVVTPTNAGTIRTQNISATPLTTGKTWGGLVRYDGAAAQTVVAGIYNNLTLATSGTATTAGIADINGTITIENSTTFNGSTFAHTVAGNWINDGVFTSTGAGTVTFDGAIQSIGGSASTTFNNLTLNGAPTTTTLAINTSVAGNLTLSTGDALDLSTFSCNRTSAGAGTLSLTASSTLKLSGSSGGPSGSNFPLNFLIYTLSGTVNYYKATGGQTIYSTPAYATLTLGNTSGTQTADGNLTVTTLNNTNAGSTLDMGTFQLAVTTPGNSGTIRTQNTSATPFTVNRTWAGTVIYEGVAQTVVAGTYSFVTLSGSGTKTMGGAINTNDNVTISSGVTLTPAAFTLTLTTATINVDGTLDFNNASGSVTCTGNSTLTMGVNGVIRTIDLNGLGPAVSASLIQGSGTFTTASIDNTGTVEYYNGAAQIITDRNYNNLIINTTAGTKTWTLTATTRTVNGDLTIAADAPFTLAGAFVLNLKGDWMKNSTGTFIPGTATVNFNGGALQTIGGTQPTTFSKISFNNTTGGITLSKPATVTTSAVFTNGIVTTDGTNIISFNTGATTGVSSNASFVNGPVRKAFNNAESFIFPVGVTGTGDEPLSIGGITAAGYDFTAEYKRVSATSLDLDMTLPVLNVSGCDHWLLDKNAGPAAGVNVTLSWDANSSCNGAGFVSNPSTLTVAHLTGGSWQEAGTAGTFSVSTVTRTNVTSFSPFSLANTAIGENGLPVMFADVKAFEKNNGVQVEWSNLTERDLIRYIVERSADGRNFASIDQQLPRTNRNDKENYTSFDAAPFAGTNFYRIKVLEISGKIIYSKILKVDIGGMQNGFTLYPSPVKGNQVSVGFTSAKGQYTINILNSAGQKVYTQRIVHQGGALTQTIELPSFVTPGVYNMTISGGTYHESKMFIVQ
jgi:hypothetical protein